MTPHVEEVLDAAGLHAMLAVEYFIDCKFVLAPLLVRGTIEAAPATDLAHE
ncbi:MAG: hypothetical protein JO283_21690 [Bradyrhizobium sp.]|nr:hypothetical protein [Bradyrhizobium sp.]